MQLNLRELQNNDEGAFLACVNEWPATELSWATFVWEPGMSHAEHLKTLKSAKLGIDLPKGHVPSSMLYGFVGGRIVGRVSIRHELNDYLLNRGGHIGYSVNPNDRKKGYATEMMKQALPYCKKIGITKLLVSCADQNTPSWKIIEKLGGELEDKRMDPDKQELTRRYWVSL